MLYLVSVFKWVAFCLKMTCGFPRKSFQHFFRERGLFFDSGIVSSCRSCADVFNHPAPAPAAQRTGQRRHLWSPLRESRGASRRPRREEEPQSRWKGRGAVRGSGWGISRLWPSCLSRRLQCWSRDETLGRIGARGSRRGTSGGIRGGLEDRWGSGGPGASRGAGRGCEGDGLEVRAAPA